MGSFDFAELCFARSASQDDRVGKKAPIVGSDCEDRRVKIGCEERSDLKVGLKEE